MQTNRANPRLSLKNLLLTTDFSAASENAFSYALAFARWYDSKLFVAHVVRPEPSLGIPLEAVPAELDRDWQDARQRMDNFTRNHAAKECCLESVLERGELQDVISAIILQHGIDLLVLGTHGRQGIKKLVLGSVAEQIFRLATCPVLTVGPKVARQPAQFENLNRILFATDFSSGSLHALRYALSLAEENEASVVFLHLIKLFPLDQNPRKVEANTKARLRALVPYEADLWCKPEFVVGHELPPEGILQVAEEREVDLIVMGVHRASSSKAPPHSPWAIAYEVVCNAHCPVLTVRA
jgi:nucleotide-binding universal stress UspA family protein